MIQCKDCKHSKVAPDQQPCCDCICEERFGTLFEAQESIKIIDNVNHPNHYTGAIETIDYIQDKLTPEGFEGYLVGNILKYMSRYRKKDGLQDIKKAEWYLKKLISTKEDAKHD